MEKLWQVWGLASPFLTLGDFPLLARSWSVETPRLRTPRPCCSVSTPSTSLTRCTSLQTCVHTLPPALPLPTQLPTSFLLGTLGGGRGHFPPGSAMPSPLSQVTLCALPRSQVLILADGDPSSFVSRQLPFLNSLRRVEDQATVYIFENQACSMPITDPSELRKLLHQ